MSRNESFVRAARRLLAFQVAAATGAAALTAWAVIEVRELVHERDRLAAQVAQIEQGGPAAAAPQPVAGPMPSPPPDATSPEPAQGPPAPPDAVPDAGPGPGPGPDGVEQIPDEARPRTACVLLDGTRSECPLPWRRVSPGICLDIQGRQARCRTGDPDSGGEEKGGDRDPPPPPPARDCRSVEGRPIVCAPPFRATPVPGVCLDRNNRPMRCPPGVQPPPRSPSATSGTPRRPPPVRPTTPPATQPSGATRPGSTTPSTSAPPTRPRQPATTAPGTGVTATAPPRTTRPATTAPATTRPAPVRRRPPPPESNQAQPR